MASIAPPLPGSTGGLHPLAGLVDHNESYGRHVLEGMVGNLSGVRAAADIGAGTGRDLAMLCRLLPSAEVSAVDMLPSSVAGLRRLVDTVHLIDIERDPLPYPDGGMDLLMANQVLEHTKEVFWIFHQVARSLAQGGRFIFGVPNVLSLHNRLLGLIGRHPTQHRLYSAHVRPFSKADTLQFLEACSPGTFELEEFGGSQFYPFPRSIARPLASAFPTLAFSIFFKLRKVGPYADGFLTYPRRARLETNFFAG